MRKMAKTTSSKGTKKAPTRAQQLSARRAVERKLGAHIKPKLTLGPQAKSLKQRGMK